ncbi:MAG: class I SAM-dependent methyltransferase [Candidatus Omnitrophota bacterium]
MQFLKIDEELEPQISNRFNARITREYVGGKRVLDVGCWSGNFVSLIRNFESNIYGLDIEKQAVRAAKKRFPELKFICGSALCMPFSSGSFDVVTCWDVIEHLPKSCEGKCLLEINRVLKNNGVLFLSTLNSNPLGKLLDLAYFFGHRHYSEEALRKLFQHSGFRVDKVYYTTGITTMLDGIVFLVFKHLLRRKKARLDFIERVKEKEFSGELKSRASLFRFHFILRKIREVVER